MSNKKITTLFILIATLTLIGIVGFTVAYFTSSTDFENEFQTGLYETTATEVFESPENWMPGDTTPKTLTVTNTGNVDVKARVCLTEEWTSSNDDTLPLEQNGERMAIINLDNTSDWTKKGNCYEYNYVLEPNDTTCSFIESVTFNSNAEADLNCTTTTNNGTTTKACESSEDGYDNATYKLTLTVETVQANKVREVWPYTMMVYGSGGTIGDEIEYFSSNTPEEVIASFANRPFYIKNKIENDILTEMYVEFIVSDEIAQNNNGMTAGTYALRGAGATYNENTSSYNEDSIYYASNKAVGLAAYGSSNCTEYSDRFKCLKDDILRITIFKNGMIDVTGRGSNNILASCVIWSDGHSVCGN